MFLSPSHAQGKANYFVLKCLGHKLLTMSAYKDENDFRNLGRKGKVVNPDNRFRDSYNKNIKVHKMQMMVKKHRTADILCIVQDKRPLYLEAKNRYSCGPHFKALFMEGDEYMYSSVGYSYVTHNRVPF